MVAFAELAVTTNYSFLIGASHPGEMVATAKALGHRAIAVTDHNSVAGVVRAHVAARDHGVRLVPGARLVLGDAPDLLVYPEDRAAWGRLCRLITLGRRRAPKGECALGVADLAGHLQGQQLVVMAEPDDPRLPGLLDHLLALRGGRPRLAAVCRYDGADRERLARLAALAASRRLALLATNDVHHHIPARRVVQDVLTAVRLGTTVAAAGLHLAANGERHLKAPAEMARLFRDHPDAVAESMRLVASCTFALDQLGYEYPDEISVAGEDPQTTLERLTAAGAERRFPGGVPAAVAAAITHELTLIRSLGYAPYFLTVHEIVRFARDRGILCQGRGSAANSAVCYCLGITAVDPTKVDLLFERFVSAERGEPPDIDVDFEHERREEVIQHIYQRYGRHRAGLAAAVTCYRARGAVRDVGKALGFAIDTVEQITSTLWGWGQEAIDPVRVREAGLDPDQPALRLMLEIARDVVGFPRHLSQHVGGFVITRGRLDEVVPVTNAAMADRTVIEWDKDDLDALRILKVDILALGMLSCIRRAFHLIEGAWGHGYDLATVPSEQPEVYEMLSRADSLGVFQVESRAQMSMLPRLRPRCYYDLVIQVAIVRPGPIQGDMVHPYLRRRQGKEAVSFPSQELEAVLGKTLGVPLFQEQAMKIAIVAAGFTPAEADRLRRAMATFRKVGIIHEFETKLIEGMVARGYDRDFATRCFRQIEGFGTYGFPESHAASFALLVYVSAWIKCAYPAAFCAALLNSQPMGFYAPAQIVRDAREHGVRVLAPDLNRSQWDSALVRDGASRGGFAVQLGFRLVKGAQSQEFERLVAARGAGYRSIADALARSGVAASTLAKLAAADGFHTLGLDRRRAEWELRGLDTAPLPLFVAAEARPEPLMALPDLLPGAHVLHDYARLGLSLKHHPLAFLRRDLERVNLIATERLAAAANGRRVGVAGLVLVRQRPGSAKGTIFITLEDETGIANLIVWPDVFERHRRIVLGSALLVARGRVQHESGVTHLVVDALEDRTDILATLAGRDLADLQAALPSIARATMARADEVRRPTADQRTVAPAANSPEMGPPPDHNSTGAVRDIHRMARNFR
ncbi:MAG: DNA polymerase III subunit alpha [Alphaproteobacteria bacterium]|nr:MAG: DNA polymerase III subunit alpha [Alphaproteobacteria bacterium]